MCEHVFLQKIKYHLSVEKMYLHKILWLHVALTCNSFLFRLDGKVVHMILEYF